MLPALIKRYDKNEFQFWSISKLRDWLTFYMLSDATFYDHINTIYQFIKPFLDKKISIFEEYGALNLYFSLGKFSTWKNDDIFLIFPR